MAEQPTASPSSERDVRQLEEIHRGWLRIRPPREIWGESSPLGNAQRMALLVAISLGVLCILPDSALSSPATNPEPPSFVHHVDGWRLAAVLLLLSLFNGWLLDLALTDQTPGKPPPPGARALRFLACGVSPLGLAAPGFWYLLFRKYRARLEGSEWPRPVSPAGRLLGAFAERVTTIGRRFLATEWTFYWVLISNLVLPYAGMLWLSSPAEMTRGRAAAIVLASVVAHLIAFAGACYYFAKLRQEQTAKWSRWLLAVLPVFWLVPVPMVFFLGLLPLFLVRIARGDDTLTAAAHDGRDSVYRLGTWRILEATLGSGWSKMPLRRRWRPAAGVDPPVTPGVEQTRLLWLYKGKSAVVLFETVFVANLLGATGQSFLAAVGLGALFIGAAALVIHLTYVVMRTWRLARLRVFDQHPYAFFVAVTQLSLFLGCAIGIFQQTGQEAPIAGFLVTAGLLGMLGNVAGTVLPIPERVHKTPAERVFWIVLLSGLAATGLTMRSSPEGMRQGLNLLDIHARTHPLLSVLLGGLLVGWLLRPFQPPQVFDQELPRHQRLLLAGLTLTAVAPLGGLFVPWWIYVRHRVWPRLARLNPESG